MVEPGAKLRVAEAIRASGGQILDFRVSRQGLRITEGAS